MMGDFLAAGCAMGGVGTICGVRRTTMSCGGGNSCTEGNVIFFALGVAANGVTGDVGLKLNRSLIKTQSCAVSSKT